MLSFFEFYALGFVGILSGWNLLMTAVFSYVNGKSSFRTLVLVSEPYLILFFLLMPLTSFSLARLYLSIANGVFPGLTLASELLRVGPLDTKYRIASVVYAIMMLLGSLISGLGIEGVIDSASAFIIFCITVPFSLIANTIIYSYLLAIIYLRPISKIDLPRFIVTRIAAGLLLLGPLSGLTSIIFILLGFTVHKDLSVMSLAAISIYRLAQTLGDAAMTWHRLISKKSICQTC